MLKNFHMNVWMCILLYICRYVCIQSHIYMYGLFYSRISHKFNEIAIELFDVVKLVWFPDCIRISWYVKLLQSPVVTNTYSPNPTHSQVGEIWGVSCKCCLATPPRRLSEKKYKFFCCNHVQPFVFISFCWRIVLSTDRLVIVHRSGHKRYHM